MKTASPRRGVMQFADAALPPSHKPVRSVRGEEEERVCEGKCVRVCQDQRLQRTSHTLPEREGNTLSQEGVYPHAFLG